MDDLHMFRKLFGAAFYRPVFKTEKFVDLWWDLEGLRDSLAGPLNSIASDGNCNYVYIDDRFPGVDSPEKFLQWCLAIVDECRDLIMKHKPENLNKESDFKEEADFKTIIQQIDVMEVLSYLAYRIQSDAVNL